MHSFFRCFFQFYKTNGEWAKHIHSWWHKFSKRGAVGYWKKRPREKWLRNNFRDWRTPYWRKPYSMILKCSWKESRSVKSLFFEGSLDSPVTKKCARKEFFLDPCFPTLNLPCTNQLRWWDPDSLLRDSLLQTFWYGTLCYRDFLLQRVLPYVSKLKTAFSSRRCLWQNSRRGPRTNNTVKKLGIGGRIVWWGNTTPICTSSWKKSWRRKNMLRVYARESSSKKSS